MMQRRDLLKTSAVWTAASYSRVFGANERIRIAGLGVGGRATYLLGLAAKAENTEIVAVCDARRRKRSSLPAAGTTWITGKCWGATISTAW
jgi:hypothetical protein